MESNRIIIANSMFFLVIVGLAYFIVQEERTLPEKPDIDQLDELSSKISSSASSTGTENRYGNLGRKPIFDTIIPQPPTPTPSPAPTPAPPPIDKVVQYWELSGVLDGLAFFHDMRSNEDITIQQDNFHQVRFGNDTINVYLESANLRDGKAVIYMKEMGQIQKKEYSMW